MLSPTTSQQAVREIEQRVAATAGAATKPLVLAVSGGVDSMVLLDAAARVAPECVAVVATFDHGSGEHSAAAAAFVARESAARGLQVFTGRAEHALARSEAAWRQARWTFLRRTALEVGGLVVTGHTEDDQVETVLMRAMRDAGARGLAALYAREDVCQPFVATRRTAIARYARARRLEWVDDPTNEDRRFLRNRVRHDILPALLRVRPQLADELLSLASRAATLRAELDAIAATKVDPIAGADRCPSALRVAVSDVTGYDAESLAMLWPAIAARVGLALDRRGTDRVVAFTMSRGRVGASIQLAGGWEVVRGRRHLVLRRMREGAPAAVELPPSGALRWGRWSFVRDGPYGAGNPWQAVLPADRPLVVRAWQPGDRMPGARGVPRRVKRFFGDAGIVGTDRAGWPVVLAGEEIVWIPGVGRCTTAVDSPGAAGLIYSCELNYR